MKHTPGPWNLNGNGILLHPVTNRQLVTQRIETYLGSFEVLDETNEPDANAHLISSAPDLLSALEEMMSVFQDHEQYDEESAEVVSIARAAIAKAKGAE